MDARLEHWPYGRRENGPDPIPSAGIRFAANLAGKITAQIAAAQASKRAAEARLSEAQIALAVAIAERAFLTREATRNLALLAGAALAQAAPVFGSGPLRLPGRAD